MSDFHPDLWNPAWNVETILTGLLSFMTGDEPTTGSIQTSYETKKKFAQSSLEWNMSKNPKFKEQFPELVEENARRLKARDLKNAREISKKNAVQSNSSAQVQAATVNVDLNNMDPEDRIRYLAALSKGKGPGHVGSTFSYWVYYILGIALVLGFFKLAN
jgi:ubiquitin-conjugating enzyme E2 J2